MRIRMGRVMTLRVLAGIMLAGAAGLVVAFAGAGLVSCSRGGGQGVGSSHTAEPLAALATATPTPIALSPVQEHCLEPLGGADDFRRQPPAVQQAELNEIRFCVDQLEGLPLPPSPTPPPPLPPGGTPLRVPTKPAGAGTIAESGGNGPSEAGRYIFLNGWYEPVRPAGPPPRTVRAGFQNDQSGAPAQGIVMVTGLETGGSSAPQDVVYPTPSRHGAVKIVGAVGETLDLQAEDGTHFYFDARALRYVDHLPPTPTPTPAAVTPAATPRPGATP
jgi:hypothetical protein